MIERRELLALCGVSFSALAGCSGGAFEETETVEGEELTDAPMEPPSEATTDYEIRSVRAPGQEPVLSIGNEEPEHDRRTDFVLARSDVDTLQVDLEPDDAESIRSFLETTDFDTKSVVIHQRPIEECYERRIEYVIAEPDRYRVQFCRRLRDATVPCSADVTEMEVVLVRVPQAYADRPSRTGQGHRSRCRHGHRSGAETATEVG